MTTTRPHTVTTPRVDPGPDLPIEDRETSFAVWTHTTMLDEDNADGLSDPTVLRGID